MDKLLTQHPPNNYSSYKTFLRDLIQDALTHHEWTFDELNYELYRLNRHIYEELTKEVLTNHVHTSRQKYTR